MRAAAQALHVGVDAPPDAVRWLAGLLLASRGIAQAQAVPPGLTTAARAHRDGDDGPGEIFWERFGHDATWSRIPRPAHAPTTTSASSDLEEAGFLGRFVQGRMQYMLVALPLEQDLAYYRDVGRGAAVQWLDLDRRWRGNSPPTSPERPAGERATATTTTPTPGDPVRDAR